MTELLKYTVGALIGSIVTLITVFLFSDAPKHTNTAVITPSADNRLGISLDSVNARVLRIESAVNNIQITTHVSAKKIKIYGK